MFEVGQDILRKTGHSGNIPAARARLRFIHTVFVILFAVFIGRTMMLGLHSAKSSRHGNGAGSWVAARADIVDRNGEILAKNTVSGHIVLRPHQVKDRDAVAAFIHNIVPEKSITNVLSDINSGKRFIYIKKLVTDSQREEVKYAKMPGVSVEETEWRRYPKRRLFSHVIGFVGTDMHGLEGAELSRDKYLRENRDPLVLSVDSRIQSVFYQELSIAMQKYHARAAMGILMNARSGEILSMVSLPDFDPENTDSDPESNRMFYPIRGVYEMGSIFKIFNTAMAAENGIGFGREYYIAKPYKILNKNGRVSATISDISSFKPPRPNLSVAEIMLHSCNVGSVQIALDLPGSAQPDFFARIHMDSAMELDFGKLARPLMPQKWGPVERATVSFGHGISVTPVHVLLGVNSMVNGGIFVWPTIYRKGLSEIRGERVISNEISTRLREIMFKIAEETSGKKARVAGINIGGKTATAEKRVSGVIDRRKNLTAFVGAFPIEAPEYIMLVVLDEPQGTTETYGLRTAAWNAVPTAGAILDSVLPMLF
ncbi:MAG: penicillin-binding protein 2 [Rickettsiales bacterium]|jgi:cell division protein FtsI (penicillin-binding protein 3)|nr:penicillin-binding protein 2 [Rickettsiales bacterium]